MRYPFVRTINELLTFADTSTEACYVILLTFPVNFKIESILEACCLIKQGKNTNFFIPSFRGQSSERRDRVLPFYKKPPRRRNANIPISVCRWGQGSQILSLVLSWLEM